MQVRVSGKQLEIGEVLPEQVRSRIVSTVEKHFDVGGEANIVFSREGAFFRADCNLHLNTGAVLTAQGKAVDAYRAFDDALIHVEKQVRRHKRKLKNHHDRGRVPKGALS